MAYTVIAAGQTDADSPIDQNLMDALRLNGDDHESRIGVNEGVSDNAIRDDFTGTAVDTDNWDVATNRIAAQDQQPDHVCHLVADAGANYAVISASTKRMRFDLDRDHTIIFEARIKESATNTSGKLFGFQDSSLAGSVANNQ